MWKRGCSLSHDWVRYSCVLLSFFLFFLNFNLKMDDSQGRWLQDCIGHLEYSLPSFVSSWHGNMNFNNLFLKTQAPSPIPPPVSRGFQHRRTSCTLLLKGERTLKLEMSLYLVTAHPLAVRLLQKPEECGVTWGMLRSISGVCKLFIHLFNRHADHTKSGWSGWWALH